MSRAQHAGWLLAGLLLLSFSWSENVLAANWSCNKNANGRWVCGAPKDAGAAADASVPAKPVPEAAANQPTSPPASDAKAAPPEPAETRPTAVTASPTHDTAAVALAKPAEPVEPPPAASGENRGKGPDWSCRSAAKSKGWACAHAAHVTAAKAKTPTTKQAMPGKSKEASAYAFTGLDDARFRSMLTVMGGDPWAASCAGRPAASAIPAEYDERQSSPLEIDSDFSEMEDNELYTFTGGVDMTRADQRLLGDFVVHDKATHTLNAHGNVIYRETGTTIAADTLFMKLDSNEGKLRNAQYVFEDVPARGKAETTYFDGKKHSRYMKATFTSCRPGNNDWMIHASRLRVDKNTGRAVASNAWLEFKGVPFFYTPWISFPTDKRRQSGFLAPNFGFSSGMGFSATLPFYWNLAPNYDVTIYPRYNARRGIILGADARYMTTDSRGLIQGQFMPDDQIRHQQRGFFSFNDTHTLFPSLTTSVNLNYVSDNRYFAEMWNTINMHGSLNKAYLPSMASLVYKDTFGKTSIYSKLVAANYEVLADNFPDASKPYRILPTWTFGGSRPIDFAGGVVSMANDISYFDHNAAPTVKRINIKPTIAFPWQVPWGFLTPRLSVQHTQYWIDNSVAVTPSPITSASRTSPIASLDGGVRFDRDTHLFGTAYTQTIEPRLFYLYVPYSNQDNIPVVNAAPYDFTFASLFRENRFSGIDRMGDANQVSAALTSRLVNQETGRETMRLSVGKMLDITAPKVTLLNPRLTNPLQAYYSSSANTYIPDRSDVIAEASAAITDSLRLTPLVIWNYQDNRADRFQISSHYDAGNNRLFNVGYRYRRGATDNSDISFSWPIAKEWSMVGRWQYQWQTKSNLESFFGVQRETCCWKFSLLARQYMTNVAFAVPNNTAKAQMTEGVFLSLELKGFANIGDSINTFLSYSIPGYETR